LPLKYAAASNEGIGVGVAAGIGVAVGGAGVGVGTPGASVAVGGGIGVAVAFAGTDVGVGSSPPQAASTIVNEAARSNPLDHTNHRLPIIPPRIITLAYHTLSAAVITGSSPLING